MSSAVISRSATTCCASTSAGQSDTSLLEINVELDGANIKNPVKNGAAAAAKRAPAPIAVPKPDPGSHPPWVKPG